VSTLAGMATSRRFTDRLNPILVKEVRQSLRGRYFRLLFWLTLFVSTMAGLMVVAAGAADEHVEELGQPFFMVMFGCMSAAVHVFTPFSAYLSTSSEWDENTHDLLVLSNLGPRQIVLGKLLSALTQALLYYSTFGPFLVFAFLLNGIDLLSISVLLGCSFAACTCLSLVGIAFASLIRQKAGRGLVMAVFGATLVMTWFGGMGAAFEITQSPQDLRDPEGQIGVVMFLTFALLIGGLFGTIAAARFAHEEENRSTGLRVLGTSVIAFAAAWGAWLHLQFGEEETAWVPQVVAATGLALLWLFSFSEGDALGRRTAKLVPASPALALLAAPFLPGGGRAVLLFLLQYLGAVLGGLIALQFGTSSTGAAEVVAMVSVYYAYALTFLALPTGIASLFVRSQRGRIVTRIATLVLVPVTILGPALMGLLFGIDDWMELRHPLNPVWTMDHLTRSSLPEGVVVGLVLLSLGVTLTLAVNARRVRAGVLEVLAASRARRERLGATRS